MEDFRIKLLERLREHGRKENIPNITPVVGKFLHFLARTKNSKKALEIGMANGVSAIYIADALEKNNGNLTCYEISEPGWTEAEKNFATARLDHLIQIRKSNILKHPPKDSEKFDFIFIDGQKACYHQFWELAKKHLCIGGVVVFDDVLKFAEKTKKLFEVMENETQWEWVVMPIDIDDGIMVVQKK